MIKLNPNYQELSTFIENIPQIFDQQGETIRCLRNHIKIHEVDKKRINVKKYGIPPLLLNRIAYVLFRDTKAKRSYDWAFRLHELGINTPTPIGYHIQKKGILLSYCYLATEHEDNIYQLSNLKNMTDIVDKESILGDFGRYTAKLHRCGVLHHDYSMGNVLFRICDGKPQFTLIDINRMSFGRVTFESGCRNFQRLGMNPQELRVVTNAYADAMGYEKERCYLRVLAYRSIKSRLLKFKRRIRATLKVGI